MHRFPYGPTPICAHELPPLPQPREKLGATPQMVTNAAPDTPTRSFAVEDHITGEASTERLETIASIREQQRTLDAELAKHVGLAREDGVTWAAIGTALGTTRQVVQERFGTPPQRVRPVSIAALAGTTATVATEINGPTGTATVIVDLAGDDSAQLIFDAEGRGWAGKALGQPLASDAIRTALHSLSPQAQEQLEAAGDHALRIDRARQAGIAKREGDHGSAPVARR